VAGHEKENTRLGRPEIGATLARDEPLGVFLAEVSKAWKTGFYFLGPAVWKGGASRPYKSMGG